MSSIFSVVTQRLLVVAYGLLAETSVSNCHHTRRNNTEERGPHLHRKSRVRIPGTFTWC